MQHQSLLCLVFLPEEEAVGVGLYERAKIQLLPVRGEPETVPTDEKAVLLARAW